MIREVDFLIVGGGPAGLCAALQSTEMGVSTVILDDGIKLGGQLAKQTHKFFGSQLEKAGTRGFVIGEQIITELSTRKNLEIFSNTTASGFFADGVVTAVRGEREWLKFRPKAILVATGAGERMLAFPGNDLPGVYGAGAVQTLMNLYGVVPGKRVLMIGAGNIGLIVSYQLMQAGVSVAAVVEGMAGVGGYWVHAAKINRLGVPILTRHTILEAHGTECVEGATICAIDEKWNPVEGSEHFVPCDIICLAVGLAPTLELLFQAKVKMQYVHELGGEVPLRDLQMRTSVPNLFIAGDVAGIEEASAAMIEGSIAGLCAAKTVGAQASDFEHRLAHFHHELSVLREGPIPAKIRTGLEKVTVNWA